MFVKVWESCASAGGTESRFPTIPSQHSGQAAGLDRGVIRAGGPAAGPGCGDETGGGAPNITRLRPSFPADATPIRRGQGTQCST